MENKIANSSYSQDYNEGVHMEEKALSPVLNKKRINRKAIIESRQGNRKTPDENAGKPVSPKGKKVATPVWRQRTTSLASTHVETKEKGKEKEKSPRPVKKVLTVLKRGSDNSKETTVGSAVTTGSGKNIAISESKIKKYTELFADIIKGNRNVSSDVKVKQIRRDSKFSVKKGTVSGVQNVEYKCASGDITEESCELEIVGQGLKERTQYINGGNNNLSNLNMLYENRKFETSPLSRTTIFGSIEEAESVQVVEKATQVPKYHPYMSTTDSSKESLQKNITLTQEIKRAGITDAQILMAMKTVEGDIPEHFTKNLSQLNYNIATDESTSTLEHNIKEISKMIEQKLGETKKLVETSPKKSKDSLDKRRYHGNQDNDLYSKTTVQVNVTPSTMTSLHDDEENRRVEVSSPEEFRKKKQKYYKYIKQNEDFFGFNENEIKQVEKYYEKYRTMMKDTSAEIKALDKVNRHRDKRIKALYQNRHFEKSSEKVFEKCNERNVIRKNFDGNVRISKHIDLESNFDGNLDANFNGAFDGTFNGNVDGNSNRKCNRNVKTPETNRATTDKKIVKSPNKTVERNVKNTKKCENENFVRVRNKILEQSNQIINEKVSEENFNMNFNSNLNQFNLNSECANQNFESNNQIFEQNDQNVNQSSEFDANAVDSNIEEQIDQNQHFTDFQRPKRVKYNEKKDASGAKKKIDFDAEERKSKSIQLSANNRVQICIGNNRIKINIKADNANEVKTNVNDETSNVTTQIENKESMMPPAQIGFQTGSGKPIEVPFELLCDAEKSFDGTPKRKILKPHSLVRPGTSNSESISRKSLRIEETEPELEMKSIFEFGKVDNFNFNFQNNGFSYASGKNMNLSKEKLEKTIDIFNDIEKDVSNLMGCGLTTEETDESKYDESKYETENDFPSKTAHELIEDVVNTYDTALEKFNNGKQNKIIYDTLAAEMKLLNDTKLNNRARLNEVALQEVKGGQEIKEAQFTDRKKALLTKAHFNETDVKKPASLKLRFKNKPEEAKQNETRLKEAKYNNEERTSEVKVNEAWLKNARLCNETRINETASNKTLVLNDPNETRLNNIEVRSMTLEQKLESTFEPLIRPLTASPVPTKKRLGLGKMKPVQNPLAALEAAIKNSIDSHPNMTPVKLKNTENYKSESSYSVTPVRKIANFSSDVSTPKGNSVEKFQPDLTPIKREMREITIGESMIIFQEKSCEDFTQLQSQIDIEYTALKKKLNILEERKNALETQKNIIEGDDYLHRCIKPGHLSTSKNNCKQRINLDQLYNSGEGNISYFNIPPYVFEITPLNAEKVHFNVSSYGLDISTVKTQDGAVVIPNASNVVGLTEISKAFQAMYGVNPKLLPKRWITNHYKWIVWKLASYERKFPQYFKDCLNIENVIQQLKYRYDLEIDKAQRPALRKILEMDDVPQKRMVLCVSNVIQMCNRCELDLTDGWYSIRTIIDKPLSDQIYKGRVKIGTKLIVQGADLLNCEGCDPLDIPDDVKLKIGFNSTRRAKWYLKLGYYRYTVPFPIQLSSIHTEGGTIACAKVHIARIYPIRYMEDNNGIKIWRNSKAEEKRAEEFDLERMKHLETIQYNAMHSFETVDFDIRKPSVSDVSKITDPGILYSLIQTSNDPDAFVNFLTPSQQRSILEYKESVYHQRQEDISSKISTKLEELKLSKRNVVPVLKLLVLDAGSIDDKAYTLNIWRPTEEHLQLLKEDTAYVAYNLSVKRTYEFHSTSRTYLKPTQVVFNKKCPRQLIPIAMTMDRYYRPLFNEFDTVGLIADILISTHEQELWLSDFLGCLLMVKINSGPKLCALLDTVKLGQSVALSNLTLQKSRKDFGQALADDYTVISQYPQQKYLQHGLEIFNQQLPKDTAKLLSDSATKIERVRSDIDVQQNSTLLHHLTNFTGMDNSMDDSTVLPSSMTATDIAMSLINTDEFL